ncbi:protein THYLAKOID FORMATION1, chloroplastic [Nicotiana tabacum]|uniref:Protein THYLAKOID FORMATION1, chloroplastic n=2 Tax=Nicotiana TaxID=4085 RepID=A0A1S3YHZ1_TOBAC|nr:PREDICTED: protein THYLAKOID FORMATION1, chloroplastic [Nicotiana sylvestris]XP_016451871.1 PREDICTED: protein THYLAKOID FORMATION1, chloroplastic [Nicotiana tabacum]
MAAVTSVSFSAIAQSAERKSSVSPSRSVDTFRFRSNLSFDCFNVRSSNSSFSSNSSTSRFVVHCMSTDLPTVAETKMNFLKAYKRPIPTVYNTVLQELIVQQHLIKYKKSYRYDPVFALGFVTVYDQLMEGYPSEEDRDAIFKAYIEALNEDPVQYRADAQKFEEWARTQNANTLVDFSSRDGEVENILKDIAQRAGTKDSFCYSRLFAVGLFRLLELANVTDPTILEKLCASLNINKKSVDRDLDVYRNLLSKLVQAKELLKEYVEREKKKRGERESQKANEAVTKCLGDYQYAGR